MYKKNRIENITCRGKKIKVLFILSGLLGNKTYNNQLISVVSEIHEIEPIYVCFDIEDYQKYKLNVIRRKFGRFDASTIIRKKIKKEVTQDFDCVFIQSFELVPGLIEIVKRYPAILAHDSTNITAYKLLYNQFPGKLNLCKYYFKFLLLTPFYRHGINNIDVFMPWSNWCASSLKDDYRVNEQDIIVTSGASNLSVWKPSADKKINHKIILLFVGNDIERKGGYFLIDLYTRFLLDRCELRILSKDAELNDTNLPEGVQHIKGIDHNNIEKLIELYQSSDIFVFPSFRDHLGLVLLEAAAAGLPIIARDVGGVSDIVKNGINGCLLKYSSTREEWSKKILELIDDKDKLAAFSKNSRKIAEENFSIGVFKEKLVKAFSKLNIA